MLATSFPSTFDEHRSTNHTHQDHQQMHGGGTDVEHQLPTTKLAAMSRWAKLQRTLHLALEGTLGKFSKSNLEMCFPKLAENIPEELEAVRMQTVEFIRSSAQEEFQTILEKRSVEHKLKDLEAILEESEAKGQELEACGQPVPRAHSWAEPEAMVYSRLLSMKKEYIASLEQELNSVTTENNRIVQELQDNHATRAAAIASIQSMHEQINSIASAFESLPATDF